MWILGEGQHLGRFDPEHGGGIFAGAEHAITDVEMPLAAVLGLVGVGEALQALVGDPDRCALDYHVEAPSPAVVASGQDHPVVVFEIAGLLLAKPQCRNPPAAASMTPISGVTCGRPSAAPW